MKDSIVTVTKLNDLMARADTPEKAMKVEAAAAAAVAWAKKQHNFEQAFEYSCAYLMSRINFYEVVKPTIQRGVHGNQYMVGYDDVTKLADYGFDKKQWSRRGKEAEQRELLEDYFDDCMVKILKRKAEATSEVEERVALWSRVAQLFVERFSNQAEAIKAYERVMEIDPRNESAFVSPQTMYEKRRDREKLADLRERRRRIGGAH